MKKANTLSVCLVIMISLIGFSCEKNTEEKNYAEVEYRIEFMDPYFNSISYIDADGNQVVINDPTNFASGSKKIAVSTKPFNAKLEVQCNNSSYTNRIYTIGIFLNGELKAFKKIGVLPFEIVNASIEYAVQ